MFSFTGVVDGNFYFELDVNSYITEIKEELKKDKR